VRRLYVACAVAAVWWWISKWKDPVMMVLTYLILQRSSEVLQLSHKQRGSIRCRSIYRICRSSVNVVQKRANCMGAWGNERARRMEQFAFCYIRAV
jgi:Co/Zn/Cd efflux system component